MGTMGRPKAHSGRPLKLLGRPVNEFGTPSHGHVDSGALSQGGNGAIMTTTLSLNATEAGGQITRQNLSWSAPLGTAAAPVTYGFLDKAPPATYGFEVGSFSRVNDAERAAVFATLAEWAAVANITFQAVDPKAFTGSATMLFANFNQKIDDAGEDAGAAHAYAPITKDRSFASREGDVWFNLSASPYDDIYRGSNDYQTVLHEIGHAIGLAHPGDYNAGDTKEPSTYENRAEYIEDSLQYTVMSYFAAAKTGANHTFKDFTYESVTPLRDDIVALQRLYGANMNTRTEDTTYGFTADRRQGFHLRRHQAVFTIWDAAAPTRSTCRLLDQPAARPEAGAFSNAGAPEEHLIAGHGIHNGSAAAARTRSRAMIPTTSFAATPGMTRSTAEPGTT